MEKQIKAAYFIIFTWTLASETDPLLEESEQAFLYLSMVALTLHQENQMKSCLIWFKVTITEAVEAFNFKILKIKSRH